MIKLIDYTEMPAMFFDFLPKDWRMEIEPYWPKYNKKAWIYCLVENSEIIAGGIVFSEVSPDTLAYSNVARSWFDKGYLYMGFIYVKESRRNQGLGSLWIEKVKSLNQSQLYWLAIDTFSLSNFYQKLGYEVVQEVVHDGQAEWILIEKNK